MYYQHNGAPAYFARQVNLHFDEKIRGGPISGPPRSPDLTALGYFLERWFKDEVYKVNVDTRDALIQCIKSAAADLK